MSRARSLLAAALLVASGCGDQILTSPVELRFEAVTAGGAHSCALDENSTAWCWGDNRYGQLGVAASQGDQDRPVRVNGEVSFRSLSAGANHTCGIDVRGGAWCWGANGSGQLGIGRGGDQGRPAPVLLALPLAAVSAGASHSCAVDHTGGVWCWGGNAFGQVGLPPGEGSTIPVRVEGAPIASSVAAGGRHSCAVGAAGAYCWGANEHYQLGGATTADSHLPVRVSGRHAVYRVVAGADHGCLLTAEQALRCWGGNDRGQLGLPGSASRGTPETLPFGGAFSALAASAAGRLSCAADIAAVWCWGEVDDPRLGPVRRLPVTVDGLGGTPASLAVGGGHACAVVDGLVLCWGEGRSGQLGDGHRRSSEFPVGP